MNYLEKKKRVAESEGASKARQTLKSKIEKNVGAMGLTKPKDLNSVIYDVVVMADGVEAVDGVLENFTETEVTLSTKLGRGGRRLVEVIPITSVVSVIGSTVGKPSRVLRRTQVEALRLVGTYSTKSGFIHVKTEDKQLVTLPVNSNVKITSVKQKKD